MTDFDRRRADVTLASALIRGESLGSAAATSGLSERTVRRRLADEGFRRSLNAARSDVLRRTADAVADVALAAVSVMREMMTDAATPASVRRAAARDVLDLSLRLRDEVQLVERVDALERLVMESA